MSMTGCFAHMPPGRLSEVEGDPDAVTDCLLADDEAAPALDIDKTWHVVHYLLTGSAWDGEGPAAAAVLGGREVSDDLGYGPARWLEPDEVLGVAAALDALEPRELALRFDISRLIELEVYPFAASSPGDVAPGACQWALDGFEALRRYYREAARSGHGMLLALL